MLLHSQSYHLQFCELLRFYILLPGNVGAGVVVVVVEWSGGVEWWWMELRNANAVLSTIPLSLHTPVFKILCG